MSTSAIRDVLIKRGEELLAKPFKSVQFTGNADADALLNDLAEHPHAFVIACLMDRQWQAEKCWLVPYRFKQRLGSFEVRKLSSLTQRDVTRIFVRPPPLHRLKGVMADVFYAAIQQIAEQYSDDASRIWRDKPSSATIVRRFLEFKGAGQKIATMAANILVRDMKIPVSDRYSIDVSIDTQIRRTFGRLGLVRAGASNEELIYRARELHPEYPGIFDLSLWEIGRQWCRTQEPECSECYLRRHCPTGKNR